MIKITGNVAALGEFGAKVAKLASNAAKRSVLSNVGEEAIELVREGFESQADPYGSRWAATKRGGQILADTGRLKGSWHRRSLSSNQVVIGSGVKYGAYHQGGTRRMVRRAMVPFRGLPSAWKSRLVSVAAKAWKSSVGFR